MTIYNTDEVMKAYQELVDENVLSLEEAQDMFDDNLNDLILDTKKEIDDAFTEGVISAYDKNICYINIGLDVDVSYENVITNLIESELSLMEEKSNKIDPKNIPTKEEFYKRELEKQAKKEKRKQVLKKVAKTAVAAGAIAGTGYLLNKAEKAIDDKSVVRPDNEEYSDYFKTRDDEIKKLEKQYNIAMKKATTDVERDDIRKQFNADVAKVNGNFKQSIINHKAAKRQAYEANKQRDKEAHDIIMSRETDPVKRAEYERQYKDSQDKWNIDKENRKKVEQFNRSDYYRRQELNSEDPDNYRGPKKLFKRLTFNRKAKKINNKYNDYNMKNIH